MSSSLILELVGNPIVESAIDETHITKFNSEDLHDHLGLGLIFLSQDKSKILLMDHVKFNFFTIPIGKVKPTETLDEALHVEMREELAVKLIHYHEVDVNTNIYQRPGGPIKVTQHVFLVDKYSGNIRNVEHTKHRSVEWYPLQAALDMNLSDTTRRMINGLLSGSIK